MRLPGRLRGGRTDAEPAPRAEACAHETLVPRWRGPEAMEDDALAMGFVCHRCDREFLPSAVADRRPRAR